MVATCEDEFFIPSDRIIEKPQNLVYSYFWERRDTDLGFGKEFLGVSFHPSLEDRNLFFDKLRESDRKKYGENVPETYFNPIIEAEHITTTDFYQFMLRDSMFRKIKGVFVLEPNLIHLLNFNQIVKNQKPLEDIVNVLKRKYAPKLMTINRLYKEISQDTSLWYIDQQ